MAPQPSWDDRRHDSHALFVMLRLLVLFAALPFLLGTACGASRSLLVTGLVPYSPAAADSVAAVTVRFARAHGYVVRDTARVRGDALVERCAWPAPATRGPIICWTRVGGGTAVVISEGGGRRPSALADSVREALASELRAHFGSTAVQRCQWHTEVDPTARWWSNRTRSDCLVVPELAKRAVDLPH